MNAVHFPGMTISPEHATRRRLSRLALSLSLALAVSACATAGTGPENAQPEAFNVSAELDAHLRMADTTLAGGDAANAADLYRRAHELHPEEAAPLAGLGHALRQLGQESDAVIAYQQAIARDPAERTALRGLAAIQISRGESENALANYEALLRQDNADHRAWNGRAIALDSLGQHERAWKSYRAGLALSPDNLALQNNYGLSLAMGGRAIEGIQILSKLAGAPDATPRTRQNLALALGLAGDIEAARQIAAIDLPPEEVAKNVAFYEQIRAQQPAPAADQPAVKTGAGNPAMELDQIRVMRSRWKPHL